MITVAALAVAGLGCGDSSDNVGGMGGDGGTGGSAGAGGTGGGAAAIDVSIEFVGKVNGADFVCGDVYDGLGTSDSSLEFSDFRFFLQDVALRNDQGEYVPVELDATSGFQTDEVVMIDFEDACGMGTVETWTAVTGTLPEGDYQGLRFTMGVPFAENHDNPATAPPPLNVVAMFWSWQAGYKFLRIDSGDFSETDWRMHLGSTGCDGDPIAGGTTNCLNPNRVEEVEFEAFLLEEDRVVADIGSLVADSDLENDQGEDPGCMGKPTDLDCGPLFENLGLPFDGTGGGAQSFFTIE